MIKFFLTLCLCCLGIVIAPLVLLTSNNFQRVIIKYWSRAVLTSLAIQIDCDSNLEKILKHDNFLVIANHVSWLDIVAINALNPVSFVAKSEIKFWPLINFLAMTAKTIFINRKEPSDVKKIVPFLSKQLNYKSICIFPEGTSTDGFSVELFKSNLFQVAIDANKMILPLAISYYQKNVKTKAASYYGDMNLLESIYSVIRNENILVKVKILKMIKPDKPRKELAKITYQKIKAAI